jgi:ABC-type multidrug transport system ATPase subunit
VDGLTFTVEPGVVTGFLGPNGAGKSTTMRMILGLDRPAAGSVTVNGRTYADRPAPLHEVGGASGGQGHPHGPERPQPPACPGRDHRYLAQSGR